MSGDRAATAVYFDDVVPGAGYSTETREVTQDDIAAFAHLTGDLTPIHLDEEFCRRGPFGRPIAHGIMGAALMSGLKSRLHLYDISSIAALGWEKLAYRRPLLAGDRIHARVVYADKRLSRSNPERGIVREQVELVNQNGEVVSDGLFSIMLWRDRTAAPLAES